MITGDKHLKSKIKAVPILGVCTILITLTLANQCVIAQDNYNFIRTWQATAPETDPNVLMTRVLKDVKQHTQYFDGLGRPEQTVLKAGSLSASGNTDFVSITVYDDLGREAKRYLPYVAPSSNGLRKANVLTEQIVFYTSPTSPVDGQVESFFYSNTEFEASPLNRVTKTLAPGINWVGSNRGISSQYWVNTVTDNVQVWDVSDVAGDFGSYSSSGFYPAGKLYKRVTSDEDNKQTIEFLDKQDRLVLKKVQLTALADDGTGSAHTGWLCTYYIYDDLNHLRAVLQPKAVEQIDGNWVLSPDILTELTFRYEYDTRNRMTMKKVPGAGTVWMVYDKRDRLVLTQDANQRQSNQWLYTKYDANNRPIITGFYSDVTNTTQALMASAVDASTLGLYEERNSSTFVGYTLNQSFPAVSTSNVLSIIYYDDYGWYGWYGPQYQNKSNAFDNQFSTAYGSWPYPEPLTATNTTLGLVTGNWNVIMGMGATGTLLANFYDEKNRVIQQKSYNTSQGTDVLTQQYSFSGQVLQTVLYQEKAGTYPQTHTLTTKYDYDDLGRAVRAKKAIVSSINGQSVTKPEITIVENEYDAIGHLKSSAIGKKLDASGNYTSTPIETLKDCYNIRGWLISINKDFINQDGYNAYFGLELGYDKSSAYSTFSNNVYDGNIAGMIWRTAGHYKTRFKYDFQYEGADRLSQATYNENKDALGWLNNNAYTVSGSSGKIAYDANGNITSMYQNGYKAGLATPLDQLTYTYFNGGNKLRKVEDAVTANNKLGDFTDKNTALDDYGYDKNGNMVSDLNKKIDGTTGLDITTGGAIQYNHLNLPSQVTIKKDDNTLKGYLSIFYDAAGTKIRKSVIDYSIQGKTITTTTNYYAGFIYESRTTVPTDPNQPDYADVLQSVPHEQGRLRLSISGSISQFYHDYFIKDHLGNVRVLLTEQNQSDQYSALSFEGTAGSPEVNSQNADWENKNGQSIDVVANRAIKPGFGATGNYSMSVRKSTGAIGAGKLLKVMTGDKIHTSVDYYYECVGCNNSTANGLNSLTSSLLLALVNGRQASAFTKDNASQLTSTLGSDFDALSFFNPQTPGGGVTSQPKAYLHMLLFDEQFRFDKANSYVEQVGVAATGNLNRIGANAVEVKKNGYAYVYFSNESDDFVYFDNFLLTHQRGPVLEETHYYPFGLAMAGVSSNALCFGQPESKRKFNGIEHNTDLDLNMYMAFFRTLDPQTGRFWQIDPKPDYQQSLYSSMNDNPIRYTDPLGDTARVRWRSGFLGIFGKRNEARYVGGQWIDAKSRRSVNINDVSRKGAQRVMNDYVRLTGIADFENVTKEINKAPNNVNFYWAGGPNTGGSETDVQKYFADLARGTAVPDIDVYSVRNDDVKVITQTGDESYSASYVRMSHELGHVWNVLKTTPSISHFTQIPGLSSGISPSELNAMYWENVVRGNAGMPLRAYYNRTSLGVLELPANINSKTVHTPMGSMLITTISNLGGTLSTTFKQYITEY